MKLYMHPVSTGARAVRLLIAENDIACDEVMVDLLSGEQQQEHYLSRNPSGLLPMLEDGDFRLTETSAILKYLADKYDLAAYPEDLKQRARVNEAMDWFNTQFYRDFGYGLVYPQMLPHARRRTEASQAEVVELGQAGAKRWLRVLDEHWLGAGKPYVCGDAPTIADYLGSAIVTLGEAIGCGYGDYPNVRRWLGNMKKLKSWSTVNQAFEGFAASNQGREFVRV
jgi:glutathione S-transferase